MILISTDKAVRPTNIMGASKRLAEIILQSYAEKEKFIKPTAEQEAANKEAKDKEDKELEDKLAKWWLPDDVVFVDEIPHTATGKIQKLTLREQFVDYKLPTA